MRQLLIQALVVLWATTLDVVSGERCLEGIVAVGSDNYMVPTRAGLLSVIESNAGNLDIYGGGGEITVLKGNSENVMDELYMLTDKFLKNNRKFIAVVVKNNPGTINVHRNDVGPSPNTDDGDDVTDDDQTDDGQRRNLRDWNDDPIGVGVLYAQLDRNEGDIIIQAKGGAHVILVLAKKTFSTKVLGLPEYIDHRDDENAGDLELRGNAKKEDPVHRNRELEDLSRSTCNWFKAMNIDKFRCSKRFGCTSDLEWKPSSKRCQQILVSRCPCNRYLNGNDDCVKDEMIECLYPDNNVRMFRKRTKMLFREYCKKIRNRGDRERS